MTFDKFLKRNQLIADHLAQIATYRDAVGWVDSSTPLDPDFRDVLAAQERLLSAAECLLESCSVVSGPLSALARTGDLVPQIDGLGSLASLRTITSAEMSTAH